MLNLKSILIALFSILFSMMSQAQEAVSDTIDASNLTTVITSQDSPFEVTGLFDSLEDILVPMTAIITPFLIIFLIIFFILRYRLRRKQAQYAVITKALEMGKDLPENFYMENSHKKSSLESALIITAVGLGLVVLAIFTNPILFGIGDICILVGIAKFVAWKIESKQQETDRQERSNSASQSNENA